MIDLKSIEEKFLNCYRALNGWLASDECFYTDCTLLPTSGIVADFGDGISILDKYQVQNLLVEFFDNQGIYVASLPSLSIFSVPHKPFWDYMISGENIYEHVQAFSSRIVALESAIEKAFEILEKRLTNEKVF